MVYCSMSTAVPPVSHEFAQRGGPRYRQWRAAAAMSAALLCISPFTAAQPAAINDGPGAETGVDFSIKPGDDFFAYANAAWLRNVAMPAGKQRWTARNDISELTNKQLAQLLDDAASAPQGSSARKVADFRAAYLDRETIEKKGMAPIKPLLDRIERIRDKTALSHLLGSWMPADVDPMNVGVYQSAHLLGLATQASIHGEKTYTAFLLQGGLGLSDREDYLSSNSDKQAQRIRYRDAVAKALVLTDGWRAAAADIASKRADAVLALETAIAQSHATAEQSANEHNADTLWTHVDFVRQAPGMDWHAYFAGAGLPTGSRIAIWQPSAVKGAAALVGSQPLQIWKDYLRVRVVAAYADVLPKVITELAPALRGAAQPAALSPSQRAQRATEATLAAMSEAIGKLYVERHFPVEQKARVQAIAANVVAAVSRRVESASWMSAGSKATALAKLKTLYFGVGYPERWPSVADLMVDRTDAVGNLQRIAARQYRRTLARLGKPVDKSEWAVAPQWVGAVLLFQQNAYNFSAGLLQAPKFDASSSDAMNYGAIGAIVGHEVIHFVDGLGAEYEVDGRQRRWWTAEDTSRYETAYAPLVAQFSNYRPYPDAAVDGKRTLTENIADLGGLAAAFDAHRAHLVATLGGAVDPKRVRQLDREFFIGFARSWRAAYRDEALRKVIAADSHAPEIYRIATVRNMDAWYDAFDVQPGHRLYLEPQARVRIW
jgi:putative endopeptidase